MKVLRWITLLTAFIMIGNYSHAQIKRDIQSQKQRQEQEKLMQEQERHRQEQEQRAQLIEKKSRILSDFQRVDISFDQLLFISDMSQEKAKTYLLNANYKEQSSRVESYYDAEIKCNVEYERVVLNKGVKFDECNIFYSAFGIVYTKFQGQELSTVTYKVSYQNKGCFESQEDRDLIESVIKDIVQSWESSALEKGFKRIENGHYRNDFWDIDFGENELAVFNFQHKMQAESLAMAKFQQDSIAYEQYNTALQKAYEECNSQLLDYPYNLDKQGLEKIFLAKNYFGDKNLKSITEEKIKSLKQQQIELQKQCYDKLKSTNPEMFSKIYLNEHPEITDTLMYLLLECRCEEYAKSQLVVFIADNKIPTCSCRENYYSEQGYLFLSRKEFDEMYDVGEKELLDNIDYRLQLKADIVELKAALGSMKSVKMKDGRVSKNDAVQNIAQKVQYHRDKYYYEEVVSMIFEYDENLVKEWEKNGRFFKSKEDFYEAYVSGNYKQTLKEKKNIE